MTAKQLLAHFRLLAHDNVQPYLWTDAELLVHLNEARDEVCRRARCIEDNTTAEVCTIAVKADKATYDLHPSILYIRRAKLDGQTLPLPKISRRDLDVVYPGWQDATSGDVRAWCPTSDTKLRLIDPPSAVDVLRLDVVRTAISPITIDTSEADIEVPPRYHVAMLDYVLHRAYMTDDELEKKRPAESEKRLIAFERMFGPAMSAAQELWNARHHGYDDYEGLA